jgi:hypothetical protein
LEKIQEKKDYSFLQGGGEMGELTRRYDWSQTSVGAPDKWPQSLRTTVSNLLRSKFPMFLWWGEDMIQFYNDAYRTSLGANGKHPHALGQKGEECWPEIWDIISPLHRQVQTTGEATWSEDQLVPIFRNGKIEDVYWTFSYSSVLDDHNQHKGILVTCMETTAEVLARKRLKRSEARLQFALKAGHLGEWQLDLETFELHSSDNCKQVFGQPLDKPFSYEALRNSIHPDDRKRQEEAVHRTIETGADYDVEYRIIWSDGSMHWVNIRGQLQYNENNAPESMVGISIDITDRKRAEQKVLESEIRFRNMVEQAPVAITLTRGMDVVIESINGPMLKIMNKASAAEVLGKKMLDVLPELEGQAVLQIVLNVQKTGIPFRSNEQPVDLLVNGELKRRYFNLSYTPIIEESGVAAVLHLAIDVTEQLEARRKLEESEQRFRLMADSISEIIWVTDAEGRTEFMNKRWEEYSGMAFKPSTAAEVAAANVHPADVPRLMAAFTDSLRTGKPMEVEQRNRSASGEYRWFLNRAMPYFDPQTGEILKWFGSSIDIHEYKVAQQALAESEERFRSMADASPVMIWTLDENGNSTYYNSRAAEFTGHKKEDLREGKSWQVAIHPDDIEFASRVVRNAVIDRMPYGMECRMQRADGEWRWLLNHGIPRFSSNGEFLGFVGSSIDITEHKKNQQELQNALEQVRLSKEAAELGTFDMDLEKGTMHWDDRCRTLFGISHHGTVTYEKDFVEGLHPDDRERITKVIDQLFIKFISNGDYDVEYRTVGAEDGVLRWVRAKGKVYFNESDKPLRFIGSVLDITDKAMAIQKIEGLVEERTRELAQANDSLLQANKELQRSNANLEEFAHAASHDLKEPVRKIHFFTHQLKQQLSSHINENEMRSFSRIENATQRMGNLIDDLLLYSHVSQRPHEKEGVDLNEKVQQALEDLDLDIEEKGAVINAGKLPLVKGYRRQLQQLFQNLISNAIKYSKQNVPPHIEIKAEEVKRAGKPYHLITVADNGIGFEQEYEDKIFQMFSRLHGKSEYSGTGVGLSIVKKVVENHNGFIKVKSKPGEGSTFEIYLPA